MSPKKDEYYERGGARVKCLQPGRIMSVIRDQYGMTQRVRNKDLKEIPESRR